MHQEILKKIQELKTNGFDIGKATGSEGKCYDGIGFFGHFEHGSIHWHPSTGTYETHGAINATWATLGWEKGILGYPTSDEQSISEISVYGLTASHSGGQDMDWVYAPKRIKKKGQAAVIARETRENREREANKPQSPEETLSHDESYGRISYFQKGAIVYIFGSGSTSVFVKMGYGGPGIPMYTKYTPERRGSFFPWV